MGESFLRPPRPLEGQRIEKSGHRRETYRSKYLFPTLIPFKPFVFGHVLGLKGEVLFGRRKVAEPVGRGISKERVRIVGSTSLIKLADIPNLPLGLYNQVLEGSKHGELVLRAPNEDPLSVRSYHRSVRCQHQTRLD